MYYAFVDLKKKKLYYAFVDLKKKKLYYAFVDLEKAFDRVSREVVRWALRKLGVDEWLSYGIVYRGCTIVRTDAGLSESFEVKVGLHQ